MPDTSSMPFDSRQFRHALGHYGTGVVVVTAVQDGLDHAMTANSFTSVSLDPPLVLVCVELDSRFYEAITSTELWAVSILAESGKPRAAWLSMKGRPLEGQFASVPHRRGELTGAPILTECVASLECRTYSLHEAGTHIIAIGEVIGLEVDHPDAPPLLYYTGQYRRLGEPVPRAVR